MAPHLVGLMSFEQELQALPHGKEFCFVEELTSLDPGKSGEGIYFISGEEEFLKGHFSGSPLWPGVVMIEAIAQLGGIIAQSDPAHSKLENLRLTAVKNAKILGSATPGETLRIKASVDGRMGGLLQIKGQVECAEKVLASAIVMLSGDQTSNES